MADLCAKVRFNVLVMYLFEIELSCNIINAFTDTFGQLNAFLLNKSLNTILNCSVYIRFYSQITEIKCTFIFN